MLRLLRVVPLAACCLVDGTTAYAEPPVVDPDLEAPSEEIAPPPSSCEGTFEFEARLRSLLEESECNAPERQLLVSLRRREAVSGTLVILQDYQAEFVREVSGPSCAEVESALTLALEIFLDPGAKGDGACAAKDETSQTSAIPSDWPGQDLDPFNLPEPEPVPLAPIVEPQARALLRAVPRIDSSFAPVVAFGLAATGRVRITPQNYVGVTLSQHVAPPFVVGDTSEVHLAATGLGVGFGQHLPIGLTGEFSLEIGPRWALLEVGSAGSSAWAFAGTMAIDLTVGLGVRVSRGVWTGVQGGGVFNLIRARYLDQESSVTWEQPWTGGHFGLYVSAAVPGQALTPARAAGMPVSRR